VEGQLEEYEASYLSAEEWTLEVALGDRLLLEGLHGWRDGLSMLSLAVSRGQLPAVDEALLLLLEGNRKLIQVQILQASGV
ncbi:hypothetical protein DYH09_11650, partial [bacterium CPR1]|nr:hypothetical protein [bacterium CPR1]